ncbi:uncharacterized protein MONOS_15658 [Monocercomonoides exilis]|uniref:uncharacterized protein n=1 Tax=Monocercomonoides exilis TaxID=2049356 RepID=UPI003559D80F|nr:hypothetical protein MONOS_15658 [Monocercomonoides exilis]|eukprot:MONOS_15658.1-p1 / transcript=MONOS_15658.1 / gene=MONOS_15658 / organism=Monocercomonoides_exilis_PA203 / gene_product=unspecified product / transcript_product=unspecified product / location=Mono_scaffold01300:8669-11827(-) / protein_length=1053 / sequence_SO=supercontig / SO=protein_coding / is_pseudo=false
MEVSTAGPASGLSGNFTLGGSTGSVGLSQPTSSSGTLASDQFPATSQPAPADRTESQVLSFSSLCAALFNDKINSSVYDFHTDSADLETTVEQYESFVCTPFIPIITRPHARSSNLQRDALDSSGYRVERYLITALKALILSRSEGEASKEKTIDAMLLIVAALQEARHTRIQADIGYDAVRSLKEDQENSLVSSEILSKITPILEARKTRREVDEAAVPVDDGLNDVVDRSPSPTDSSSSFSSSSCSTCSGSSSPSPSPSSSSSSSSSSRSSDPDAHSSYDQEGCRDSRSIRDFDDMQHNTCADETASSRNATCGSSIPATSATSASSASAAYSVASAGSATSDYSVALDAPGAQRMNNIQRSVSVPLDEREKKEWNLSVSGEVPFMHRSQSYGELSNLRHEYPSDGLLVYSGCIKFLSFSSPPGGVFQLGKKDENSEVKRCEEDEAFFSKPLVALQQKDFMELIKYALSLARMLAREKKRREAELIAEHMAEKRNYGFQNTDDYQQKEESYEEENDKTEFNKINAINRNMGGDHPEERQEMSQVAVMRTSQTANEEQESRNTAEPSAASYDVAQMPRSTDVNEMLMEQSIFPRYTQVSDESFLLMFPFVDKEEMKKIISQEMLNSRDDPIDNYLPAEKDYEYSMGLNARFFNEAMRQDQVENEQNTDVQKEIEMTRYEGIVHSCQVDGDGNGDENENENGIRDGGGGGGGNVDNDVRTEQGVASQSKAFQSESSAEDTDALKKKTQSNENNEGNDGNGNNATEETIDTDHSSSSSTSSLMPRVVKEDISQTQFVDDCPTDYSCQLQSKDIQPDDLSLISPRKQKVFCEYIDVDFSGQQNQCCCTNNPIPEDPTDIKICSPGSYSPSLSPSQSLSLSTSPSLSLSRCLSPLTCLSLSNDASQNFKTCTSNENSFVSLYRKCDLHSKFVQSLSPSDKDEPDFTEGSTDLLQLLVTKEQKYFDKDAVIERNDESEKNGVQPENVQQSERLEVGEEENDGKEKGDKNKKEKDNKEIEKEEKEIINKEEEGNKINKDVGDNNEITERSEKREKDK